MSDDHIREKQNIYYGAALNAWLGHKMELDRQLLTLSTLAIGLLMSFGPQMTDLFLLLIWLFSALMFVFCIVTILSIFAKSADHLKCIIQSEIGHEADGNEEQLSKSLNESDRLAVGLFVAGVGTSVLLIFIKYLSPFISCHPK